MYYAPLSCIQPGATVALAAGVPVAGGAALVPSSKIRVNNQNNGGDGGDNDHDESMNQ